MGHAFTAKDFRTWAGTILAARALHELIRTAARGPSRTRHPSRRRRLQLLNNTRSVCRKCYIHPTVIDAYLDGGLEKALHGRAARINGLSSFESSVVRMLRHRARHEKPPRRLSVVHAKGGMRLIAFRLSAFFCLLPSPSALP